MKWVGRVHTAIYKATRGLVGARADGLDMLLLTTRGRRTGRSRTTPLPWFRSGNDVLLIASFGGGPRDPAWLANLRAQPKARIQVRGRVGEVEARIAEGEEREVLWNGITARHPRYIEYQQRTERRIPVVVLVGAASLA